MARLYVRVTSPTRFCAVAGMSSAPKIKSRRARRPDLRYVAAVGRGYIPDALLRGGRDVVGAEDQELLGQWSGWRAAEDQEPSGASARPTSEGPATARGRGYRSEEHTSGLQAQMRT